MTFALIDSTAIVLSVAAIGMASSPEEIATGASSLIDAEGGFVPFIQNVGLGGIAYATILETIGGIQSFGTVLLGPVRALGHGLILLVDTTIGGMLDVFDAGTRTTVQSFLDGTASLLGPLAQPAAVGTMMITLAVFMYAINRLEISPLSFLQSLRR